MFWIAAVNRDTGPPTHDQRGRRAAASLQETCLRRSAGHRRTIILPKAQVPWGVRKMSTRARRSRIAHDRCRTTSPRRHSSPSTHDEVGWLDATVLLEAFAKQVVKCFLGPARSWARRDL